MEIYRLPFINKKCPHCGGSLNLEPDGRELVRKCLNCARAWELKKQIKIKR
jgi:tRNA(Ile2) C34 agmatinyltransferase TiaS